MIPDCERKTSSIPARPEKFEPTSPGRRGREIPRRDRDPRKPGTESSHRGRRAAGRSGGLFGGRSRCPIPVWGDSRESRRDPAAVSKARSRVKYKNFTAAVQYLKTHPHSTGKVGCMGFCWGAASPTRWPSTHRIWPRRFPSTASSRHWKTSRKSRLRCFSITPVRTNASTRASQAFEAALKKASVDYRIYIYEGAGHAFFNDTNDARYHKEAAQLAWQRTIAFFKEKLKT